MGAERPADPRRKITRAMARRLAQSKGRPVAGVVFAAVEGDKLTLASFAARAAERDAQIRAKLAAIMARIGAWEQTTGQRVEVTFRPQQAAVAITAPATLFEELAGDDAVAAVDVDTP